MSKDTAERLAVVEHIASEIPALRQDVGQIKIDMAHMSHTLDLAIARLAKAAFQGAMVAVTSMVAVAAIAWALRGAFGHPAQAYSNPSPKPGPERAGR